MGGGNGQKSKTARERNLQKLKASKGNTLTSSLINMYVNISLQSFSSA